MEEPGNGEVTPKFQPDDPRHLHLWQIQSVRDIAVIALVIFLILCGYWLRSVTVPLLIALALAYLFEPIIVRVTRRFNVSRPVVVGSLVGAVAILFAVALLGVALSLVQTVQLLRTLPDTIGGAIRFVDEHLPEPAGEAFIGGLESLFGPADGAADSATVQGGNEQDEAGGAQAESDEAETVEGETAEGEAGEASIEPPDRQTQSRRIAENIRDWVHANLGTVFQATVRTTGDAISLIFALLGSTIYIAFTLFLIPFYFYAFSTGWPKLRDGVVELFPVEHSQNIYDMLHKMDRAVSGFVRGRVVISAIMGVLLAAGWWACGVPYWLLLGILTGVLSMVPYLGGIGLPLAIGLLWMSQADAQGGEQMAWWAILLWPSVVFTVVQLVEGYVLTPVISGKATNLGPVSVLVVVLAGGVVAGVYGMLLAIPVAACGKIIITDVVVPRIKAYGRGQVSDVLPIDEQ